MYRWSGRRPAIPRTGRLSVRVAARQRLPAADVAPGADPRLAQVGMGRIGQPQDVANVARFLASDLSSYVTGQVIGVDGAMVV